MAADLVRRINSTPAGTVFVLSGIENVALRNGEIRLMEAASQVGRPKK